MTEQEILSKSEALLHLLVMKGFKSRSYEFKEGDVSPENVKILTDACNYLGFTKEQIDKILTHNRTNGWKPVTGKLIIRDGKMYEEPFK